MASPVGEGPVLENNPRLLTYFLDSPRCPGERLEAQPDEGSRANSQNRSGMEPQHLGLDLAASRRLNCLGLLNLTGR